MKKRTVISLCLLLLFSGCAASEEKNDNVYHPYKPGTYTASADGFGGEVKASVEVDRDKILSVTLEGENETEQGAEALPQLAKQMSENATVQVDLISGATRTSEASLQAAEKALKLAYNDPKRDSYQAGTYTAEAEGMYGPVSVSVTFSNDAITSVDFGENNESLLPGRYVMDMLAEEIVSDQTLALDTVSGATVSSKAVLDGVEDCVRQAYGSPSRLKIREASVRFDYSAENKRADVLVIGGGLAGLTAAISAAQSGASVILLEAKEFPGGNALYADNTFLLGNTDIQHSLNIEDDEDSFYRWLADQGRDTDLAAYAAAHSQDLIDFFASLNIPFYDEKINGTEYSDVNRGHQLRISNPEMILNLVKAAEEAGVSIRYGSTAESFLFKGEEVCGVEVTDLNGNKQNYYGTDLILACGGFSGDSELIEEYWGSDYAELPQAGSSSSVLFRQAIDVLEADVIDMGKVHLELSVDLDRHIPLSPALLRSGGGVMISGDRSRRFEDEQVRYGNDLLRAMRRLEDPFYVEIFNGNAAGYSEQLAALVRCYEAMGVIKSYDSIEAIAAGEGLDPEKLRTSLEEYNEAVREERSDRYGREKFNGEITSPYYVASVNNGRNLTPGGLLVNQYMQVWDIHGELIPHLYACGEIAGGYLGSYHSGDGLAHAALSGMNAGLRQVPEEEAS
ncbi:MAG: FAD-binding protein [Erysipelotrichaceae bacterium]|nr:FAD-binding protein [Erysipelotrichaceae bacterium]